MSDTPPPLAERIEYALRIAAVPWAANMPPLTQHGEGGHRFETGCSLCHGDAPSLVDAVLAVVQPELDGRDAEIDRLRMAAQAAATLLRSTADKIDGQWNGITGIEHGPLRRAAADLAAAARDTTS
ncbi:hypothetical protein ACFXDE_01765 [Kitasatospora sp. NPDC059408]|uniref:hypothetical protein n=1 Tax=Kitasatospora sp. NPDC059408 TaxID=3346823 RepID=UPI00369F9C4F